MSNSCAHYLNFYKFDEENREQLELLDSIIIRNNSDTMDLDELFANQKGMQQDYPEPRPTNHDLCDDSAEPVLQRKPFCSKKKEETKEP